MANNWTGSFKRILPVRSATNAWDAQSEKVYLIILNASFYPTLYSSSMKQ